MMNVYFLTQVKHNKVTNTWDKGVVVKANPEDNNKEAVLQAYHSYLGAYAYRHDPNTDYVFCQVTEAESGVPVIKELWIEEI